MKTNLFDVKYFV